MKYCNYIFSQIISSARRLRAGEDGAISADWIVLTVVITMMGLAAAFFIGANIPSLAGNIGAYMSERFLGK